MCDALIPLPGPEPESALGWPGELNPANPAIRAARRSGQLENAGLAIDDKIGVLQEIHPENDGGLIDPAE
mgnify:CR=1 FL=1